MKQRNDLLNEVKDKLSNRYYLEQRDQELVNDCVDELLEAINYTRCCTELKAFKDEFIEAWEDGSGGDSDLYRKAKSL